MSAPTPAKNVVVLGGGGAGVAVAQSLSKSLDHAQYNLILVDMRPYMIWLPAGARMVVTRDEAFTDTVRSSAAAAQLPVCNLVPQAVFPYDKVFPPGRGTFKLVHQFPINFPL